MSAGTYPTGTSANPRFVSVESAKQLTLEPMSKLGERRPLSLARRRCSARASRLAVLRARPASVARLWTDIDGSTTATGAAARSDQTPPSPGSAAETAARRQLRSFASNKPKAPMMSCFVVSILSAMQQTRGSPRKRQPSAFSTQRVTVACTKPRTTALSTAGCDQMGVAGGRTTQKCAGSGRRKPLGGKGTCWTSGAGTSHRWSCRAICHIRCLSTVQGPVRGPNASHTMRLVRGVFIAAVAMVLALSRTAAGAALLPESWTMADVEAMAGAKLGDWTSADTARFLSESKAVSPAIAAKFESEKWPELLDGVWS